jgi:hypothetical protein
MIAASLLRICGASFGTGLSSNDSVEKQKYGENNEK